MEENLKGLSEDQKKVLRDWAAVLFEAVSAYGVSPLRVEPEDLDEDTLKKNCVWSVVEFHASGEIINPDIEDGRYRTDEMLVPRFIKGAYWYHRAGTTYSDDSALAVNPHTSLIFTCAWCESLGCENCGGEGQFTFLAVWDSKVANFIRR